MPLGSYLLWRLGPRTKVFIDGRLDMYGSKTFDIYGRMHEQPGQFAKLSGRYQIGYCVLAHPRGPEGLGTWLQEDRDWALLYWDESGMVFARRTPENQKIIRQFEYRMVTCPGVLRRSPELLRAEKIRVVAEIRRLMQDDPDGRLSNFAAGVALLGLGRMEPARGHLERALKADPEMLPAIAPLAAIYYQQRRYEKMPPLLERGVRVDPEDARLRLQLATAYLLTKQYRKAIGEARVTLERDPTSFQAALVLAKACAAEGNRDEALGWLERVRELAGPLPASEAAAREFDSIRNDPRFGEMIQP